MRAKFFMIWAGVNIIQRSGKSFPNANLPKQKLFPRNGA